MNREELIKGLQAIYNDTPDHVLSYSEPVILIPSNSKLTPQKVRQMYSDVWNKIPSTIPDQTVLRTINDAYNRDIEAWPKQVARVQPSRFTKMH
jgi:hypothetical protein